MSTENVENIENTPEAIIAMVEDSGDEAQARWLRTSAGKEFLAEQGIRDLVVAVENDLEDQRREAEAKAAAEKAAAEEKARAEAAATAKAAAEVNGENTVEDADADADAAAEAK